MANPALVVTGAFVARLASYTIRQLLYLLAMYVITPTSYIDDININPNLRPFQGV